MKIKPLLLNQVIGKRDLSSHKNDLDFKNNMLKIFKNSLETSEFKKRILILTSLDDSEINILGPHFIKNKIDYLRINCENFSDFFDFSITIPNTSNKNEIHFTFFDTKYSLDEFDFIWIRHFNNENFFFFQNLEYTLHKYLLSEWTELFYSILELSSHKSLTPVRRQISKPLQLIEAKKSGFSIPHTIITNSKKDLDIFFRDFKTNFFRKSTKTSFYIWKRWSIIGFLW